MNDSLNEKKLELELEMLKKSLEEEKGISVQLTQNIEEENKKIQKLNDKIENLLQEQKYEIIELVQVINNFYRHSQNKVVLTKEEFEKIKSKAEEKECELEELRKQTRAELDEKDQHITELRSQVQEFKGIMLKQNQFIGQYRGSVVFPLYRITSGFGETSIGKIIQKIVK